MSANGTIHLIRDTAVGRIEFEQRPPSDTGFVYRAYHLTPDGGKRERLTSVTTFLDVLSKRALLRWYEQKGIEAALAMERGGLLKNVSIDEATDVLRRNKAGAEAARDAAAQRGIEMHTLVEHYVATGEVPIPAAHPPEHRGYVRGIVRWLLTADRRGLEVEASERLVANPKLGYAGRLDLRAKLGGLSHVIDFKTNQQGRVYKEHHYQVTAYAVADEVCGAEPVHSCLIVAIGADGQPPEEMRSLASPADFKAVLDLHRRDQRLEAAVTKEHDRLVAVAEKAAA